MLSIDKFIFCTYFSETLSDIAKDHFNSCSSLTILAWFVLKVRIGLIKFSKYAEGLTGALNENNSEIHFGKFMIVVMIVWL